jgi:hypothetical protein
MGTAHTLLNVIAERCRRERTRETTFCGCAVRDGARHSPQPLERAGNFMSKRGEKAIGPSRNIYRRPAGNCCTNRFSLVSRRGPSDIKKG